MASSAPTPFRHAFRRATIVAALVTLSSSLTLVWTADGAAEPTGPPQAIAFPAPQAGPDAAPVPRAGPGHGPALPDAAPAVPVSPGRRAAQPAAAAHMLIGKLNLNTANAAELDLLPGIGPTKAGRVVAWRRVHGRFRRVRDLRRVKGFGKKTLEKLAPYLRVTGPTTLQAPQH